MPLYRIFEKYIQYYFHWAGELSAETLFLLKGGGFSVFGGWLRESFGCDTNFYMLWESLLHVETSLLLSMTASGLLGFVVGYALKKLLKLFLVICGVFAILLYLLEEKGVIEVNWEKFAELVSSGLKDLAQLQPPALMTTLPFFAGLALGLKIG